MRSNKVKIMGVVGPAGHYDAKIDDFKVEVSDTEITLKNVKPKNDFWSNMIKKQLESINTDLLGNPIPKMTDEERLKREVEKPYHYNIRPNYETIDVMRIMSTGKEMLQPMQQTFYTNAIKYLDRFPFKETAVKDLWKSIEYIKFLIADIEQNGFREEIECDD